MTTSIDSTSSQQNVIALSSSERNIFSQNDIVYYDPSDCMTGGGISSESCFKIDGSVEASDFWYAEGCLNTGACTSGRYFASNRSPKSDNGLIMTRNNPWIYNDTETDESFGGMQYIYAENYDYEYNGAYTKMTPNGGNSTQKYYWIVLPDQAYSNGFGETYVATFEKSSEPVYFIVFDTHACPHQSADYCSKAKADPEGVAIGKEFLGAFTKKGGNYTEIVNILGKLTSLCRIKGSGEVTAHEDASNMPAATEKTSTSPSSTTSVSTTENSATTPTAVEDGLTKEQAQVLADYYNSDAVAIEEFGFSTKENCVAFVGWFEAYFGDFYSDYQRVTYGNGDSIATYLSQHHNVPTGTEPKLYSVFSTTGGRWHSNNHTGIIVGINGDKVISIEAAFNGWLGWDNGKARVFEMTPPSSGITYAYIADRIDYSKLAEIVNSVSYSNGNFCANETITSAIGEAANIPLEERMKWLFPDGTPTSQSAMSQYLETIEVPIKNESGSQTTMKLTIHKKLAEEIKAVFQDMLNVSEFRVKASSTAGYNWRKMASGTGKLSHHSYGVAIDLNWNDNPATYTGGTYNPGGNYYSVTNEIVEIWKKHGFYWGGDWSGRYKDYMHFTYTNH